MKSFLVILLIASLLIVVGCGSDLLKDPYYSIPKKLTTNVAHNFKGKVIIIGAGAAGLSAANVLENSNVDYKILEATDRYGGRIKMNDSFADFPIDLGAEWIHNKKAILNRLNGKDGNEPSEDVILYQPRDIYLWDGETYSEMPKGEVDEMYTVLKEYKFKNATWYQFIDNYFAQNVKQNIVYNSPVISINYEGNQVVVTTKNGEKHTADKVIITVSIGVLKSNAIAFEPALPAKKIAAINSVVFPRGFKLFLKFSEKFYPDMIMSETEVGEKTYYDVAYHKDKDNHILGLLSTGTTAEAYYKLGSKEEIVAAVLKELDIIFEGKASQYYSGTYVLKDWGRQAFTLGTWTEGFDEDLYDSLLQSLDNKVYFAGETFGGVYNSTVHGAIISGNKQAIEMLKNR
ncbi:flavin monoamine oxidase family protein [Tenacibaculum amylolyticum]|uniref:flavin monoamine oxidase family protein n=1 Tax=Tenacibaculum amylolyticum TaxID=104269 RepID=UPI0038B6A0E6